MPLHFCPIEPDGHSVLLEQVCVHDEVPSPKVKQKSEAHSHEFAHASPNAFVPSAAHDAASTGAGGLLSPHDATDSSTPTRIARTVRDTSRVPGSFGLALAAQRFARHADGAERPER